MKDFPEFLTSEEARKILRVSRATIYRILNSRQLSFYKVGHAVRIDPRDILEYLSKSRSASRNDLKK